MWVLYAYFSIKGMAGPMMLTGFDTRQQCEAFGIKLVLDRARISDTKGDHFDCRPS